MSLAASLDRLSIAWQHLEIPAVDPEEIFFPQSLPQPPSNVPDPPENSTYSLKLWVIGTGETHHSEGKDLAPEIRRIFLENRLLFAGLASVLKRSPGFATSSERRGPQDGRTGLFLSKHYFASDDWSLTWTYDHDIGTTRAVLLYWLQGGSSFVKPFLQEVEDVQDCLGQPELLGFIASKMTLSKVMRWNEQCNVKLLAVEQNISLLSMPVDESRAKLLSMTREQRFALGVEDRLNYGTVSMQIHNLSDMVIKIRRYLRYLDHYNTILRENVPARPRFDPDSSPNEMAESLRSLNSYVAVWTLKNEAVGEHLANQASALKSFIMRDEADMSLKITQMMQDDAGMSLKIIKLMQDDAHMSLDIAKDTRKLAVESKRDSASMKTIAIVSMVFLPWTFLATFFAMPMFDWKMPAGQNVSSRSFWVYWAAASPLTLLVLAIWQVGLFYKKRIEKKQDAKAMRDLKRGDSAA